MAEDFPEKFKFSQQELAKIFGVTHQAIAKWKIVPIEDRGAGNEKKYFLPAVVEYQKTQRKKKVAKLVR
jgi:phage terminase Nu1 subunit (DNA packaging protein)